MAKKLSQIATELATVPVKQTKAMQDDDKRLAAFNDIKAETDKIGSVNGEAADWSVIEKSSINYLRKAEKDIRIAVYLARAWAMSKDHEGMTAGAVLVDALLEHRAEELHPPRVNGRRQAINWWAKQGLVDWQQRLGASTQSADRNALEKALASIKTRVAANPKLVGKPSELDGLINGLDKALEPIDETPSAEKQVSETSTDKAKTSTTITETDTAESSQEADEQKESAMEPEANSDDVDKSNTETPKAEQDPEFERLVEQLLAPVSSELPAGDDQYLSDEFSQIQSDINAGWRAQSIEWDDFLLECTQFLQSKSKDIRVLAYAIYAMAEVESLAGLTRGVRLLEEFVNRFATTCFPDRVTGRRAALSWLAKSIHEWFRRRQDNQFELSQLQQTLALFDQLNQRLYEDEELAVRQGVLGKAITALKNQIEIAEANVPPTPAARASAQPAEAVPSTKPVVATQKDKPADTLTVETLEDEASFRTALSSGNRYILNLVRYKRTHHPQDPISYRWLRQWAWGALGKTIRVDQLPAPRGEIWDKWEQLIDSGDSEKLLETAESQLFKQRFCLDLNRYSCIALEQLGHVEAANAVKDEVVLFVKKYPGLPASSFKGGDAVADGATQDWIQQIQQNSSGDAANMTQSTATSEEFAEKGREALAKARQFIKEGEKSSAVAELESHLRLAESQREKFYWRQLLARLFLESNAIEMALVMLETLEQAIVDYRLEEWDSNLPLDLALLVQQVDQKIAKNSPLRPRIQRIVDNSRARVTRLDPSLAIERFGRKS